MNGKSLDTKEDVIKKLRTIAPQVFNEDKIDWEKLKSTFGDDINFADERYVLNWAGKSDAFRAIQTQTTATLIPDKEESVNFDETGNLFIEGENLEVLKVLQKAYYGKIKMIYIDPPYNTGNDFIYNDKFAEKRDEYLLRSGEKDEEGLLTNENLYRKNSKESGHYHSNWLTMMYPRLFLARNLLRDDGVIFISIGQDEIHNLILIMNEIFGEENHIGNFVRLMKTGGNKGTFFSPNTEYIVIYAKHINELNGFRDDLPESLIKKVYTQIEDKGPKKGEKYRIMGLYQAGLDVRPNQRYWIKCPDCSYVIPPGSSIPLKIKDGNKTTPHNGDGVWRWTYETFVNEMNKNNILFKKTKTSSLINEKGEKSIWNIYTKIWLKDRLKEGRIPTDFITKFENRHSSQEMKELDIPFDFAKPQKLIKYLLKISQLKNNDIILDFFSGSSSTAHAVLDLNKEDASTRLCSAMAQQAGSAQVYGSRKFIMVQLPEKTDEKSEAYKAGFETIADIGKERIRRVIKKIQSEPRIDTNKHEKEQPDIFKNEDKISDNSSKSVFSKQDLGFKVFKLHESNFKIWRGDKFETEQELEKQLETFVNPVKEGSTEENMLYELLLKSGIDLNCKIEKIPLSLVTPERCKGGRGVDPDLSEDGVCYYLINENELIIALSKINEEIIKNIIEAKPQKVITLDKLFEGNDKLKTNTILQMKDAGIEFKAV